jgi:hypothetical protein
MTSGNKMQDDVAACLSSSMLQPDMLLPVRACCSPFEHVAAGHIAACSSSCSRT